MQSTNSKPLITIVYIDGFNLYHSLKNTPYKWLNIEKLINSILDSSWHNVIKIKYFTANTPFSKSAQRQDLYLRTIKTLQKVEVVYGKFKKRYMEVKNTYVKKLSVLKGDPEKLNDIQNLLMKNIIQFPKYEEKETDVNIATHIMYDCCKEDVDSIVLLSNDTDLKLPLRFARNSLKKRIIIITPTEYRQGAVVPMKAHQDLKKISHKSLSLTEEHLKESQFPNIVGEISKPQSWS